MTTTKEDGRNLHSTDNRGKHQANGEAPSCEPNQHGLLSWLGNLDKNGHTVGGNTGGTYAGDSPAGDEGAVGRRTAAQDAACQEDSHKRDIYPSNGEDSSHLARERRDRACRKCKGSGIPGYLGSAAKLRGDGWDCLGNQANQVSQVR
jgi:hypothetical protein